MATEAELRALEQQLLQESYQDRADFGDTVQQQSHLLLEATSSIRLLSHTASGLLNLLTEMRQVVVEGSRDLYQTDASVSRTIDAGGALTEVEKKWTLQLLVRQGHISTALLLDPHSVEVVDWLRECVSKNCTLEHLSRLAYSLKALTLLELIPTDYEIEMPCGKLAELLTELMRVKELKIEAEGEECIIPLLIGMRLDSRIVHLNHLQFTKSDIDLIIRERQSKMTTQLIDSLKHCHDDADLIGVVVKVDKEFEEPRKELVAFILAKLEQTEPVDKFLRFIQTLPKRYQTACAQYTLTRLDQDQGDFDVDPDCFLDKDIKEKVGELRRVAFERDLLVKLQNSSNPVKELLDVKVPRYYNGPCTEDFQEWIKSNVSKEDLFSMRLLFYPFIACEPPESASPKSSRFEMLPSPDSTPPVPKIPLKQHAPEKEYPTTTSKLPSPTSPPTANASSTKSDKKTADPLQSLMNILPF
jgi:hypothetical protein